MLEELIVKLASEKAGRDLSQLFNKDGKTLEEFFPKGYDWDGFVGRLERCTPEQLAPVDYALFVVVLTILTGGKNDTSI